MCARACVCIVRVYKLLYPCVCSLYGMVWCVCLYKRLYVSRIYYNGLITCCACSPQYPSVSLHALWHILCAYWLYTTTTYCVYLRRQRLNHTVVLHFKYLIFAGEAMTECVCARFLSCVNLVVRKRCPLSRSQAPLESPSIAADPPEGGATSAMPSRRGRVYRRLRRLWHRPRGKKTEGGENNGEGYSSAKVPIQYRMHIIARRERV